MTVSSHNEKENTMDAARTAKDKALLEAMWPSSGVEAAAERDNFVEGFDRGWDAALAVTYDRIGVRPTHVLISLPATANMNQTEAEILAVLKNAEPRGVGRVA